jgi:alkyl hydroperoxide reductase subunit AhpC
MRLFTAIIFMLFTVHAIAGEIPAKDATDFTLKSLSGDNIRLREQMGDVILLNFWASWCGPCREEMPELEKLQQKYQALGFKVMGVNVETSPDKARDFLKNISVSFPIVLDTEQSVSKSYAVQAMPTTYLIDRQGKLRFLHKGYEKGTAEIYETHIKKLIRE